MTQDEITQSSDMHASTVPPYQALKNVRGKKLKTTNNWIPSFGKSQGKMANRF